MQEILINLKVGSVLAELVDEYNQSISTLPSITRGMRALLRLRLFDAQGNPLSIASLAFVSWDFVLANDWNTETAPQIRVQTGIAVVVVSEGGVNYSEIHIPLTETNTEELVSALGSSASVNLGAELAGFEENETVPGFLMQFDMTVRNRRGTAGAGTPVPVGDGTYSSAQVDALLITKAEVVHYHNDLYAPLDHDHNDLYASLVHDHDGVYMKEDIPNAYNRAASVLASMMLFVRNGAVNAYLTLNDIREWLKLTFSEVTHNHDESYADLEHDHEIAEVTGLNTALDGKADTDHNHDGTYAVPSDIPSDLSELTDTSGLLTAKADTVHTHTISQVDGLQTELDGKTTEAYVDVAVAGIVNSSPAALDTLNELAAALGNDPNFATTVTNLIATKADIDHTHDDATAQVQPEVIYFTAADLVDGSLEIQPAIFQVFDDTGSNVIPSVDYSGETMRLDFSDFGAFAKPWKILLINSFITATFTAADLTDGILSLPGEVYPVFFNDAGLLDESWDGIAWSGGNTLVDFGSATIDNAWTVIYYAPRQLKIAVDGLSEIAISEHAVTPCVIDAVGNFCLPNIALSEHKTIIDIAGFGLTGTCVIPTEKGVSV